MHTTAKTHPKERAPYPTSPAPLPGGAPSAPATPKPGRHVPVLNLQNLTHIVLDTGTRDLAINFLRDFMDLLEPRTARIRTALIREDPKASTDAVLSLKTASSMAGAMELEELCVGILACLSGNDFHTARDVASALGQSVGRIVKDSPTLVEEAKNSLTTKQSM